MTGMEQGDTIPHVRVGGDNAPHHVTLQIGRSHPEQLRDTGEGIQVVVDQLLRFKPAVRLTSFPLQIPCHQHPSRRAP